MILAAGLLKETQIDIGSKREEGAHALNNPAIKAVDEDRLQSVYWQVTATRGVQRIETVEVFVLTFACALADDEQSRDCTENVGTGRKYAKEPINRAQPTAHARKNHVGGNRFE